MVIKALISSILLLSCLTTAQTDVQFSEIETNPIPTMVNFDGDENTVQEQQQVQVKGYYDLDGKFIPTQYSSNDQQTLEATDTKSTSLINDPNNFLLANEEPSEQSSQNQEQQNTQIHEEENENHFQVYYYNKEDINDLSMTSYKMIDTEGSQVVNQTDKQTEQSTENNSEEKQQIQDSKSDDQSIENISQEVESKNQEVQQSDCIIIYSQCHYKGESLQLCQSLKDIDNFDHEIRSIYVPQGYTVRLYNQEDFSGERTVIKQSEDCLLKPLSLTQLFDKRQAKFMILAQNSNLRRF